MKEKCKEVWNKPYTIYIVTAIVCAVAFCAIYGVRILNPRYTDWLLNQLDLEQHYLGWKAYRNSPWMFPIGYTNALVYPARTSIIFTDSIPIFAWFFKLLSPILPAEFQYFGLWGILCFVLQGVLAARIIRQFTESRWFVLAGSCLFIFMPAVIWRMYMHTSLAGQWLLLLALEPLFAYKKYSHTKKIYMVAGLTALLAASMHMYFVLICGIIVAAVSLLDVIACRRIKRAVLLIGTYVMTAFLIVGLWGGFSSVGSSAQAGGLGEFSFNLNAFFNPLGWSSIYKDLPVWSSRQCEGFTYLGAGVIFALFMGGIAFAGNPRAKVILREHWKELLAFAAASAVAVVIAVSPVITFGDTVIKELVLPEFIMKLWGTFRATGRVAWVALYIIMLCSCVVLWKVFNKRTAVMIMSLCLILQVYDLHNHLILYHNQFSQVAEDVSPLENMEFWNVVGNNEEIEHVVFVSLLSDGEIYNLTDWATDYQMTVSWYAVAHPDLNIFKASVQNAVAEITDDEIFIFAESDSGQCSEYDLNYYSVGKYIVGYSGLLDGFTPMSFGG